jgi:hypothetical protein
VCGLAGAGGALAEVCARSEGIEVVDDGLDAFADWRRAGAAANAALLQELGPEWCRMTPNVHNGGRKLVLRLTRPWPVAERCRPLWRSHALILHCRRSADAILCA